MPIGIEHMEITFAPRGILRRLGTKAAFAKVRPKAINIRNVKISRPQRIVGSPSSRFRIVFPPLFAEM